MPAFRYNCGFCGKNLRSKQGFKRHVLSCHQKATEELLDVVQGLEEGQKEAKSLQETVITGRLFIIKEEKCDGKA